MAEKILGIDLGTNSIGLSVRNPELGDTLNMQLEYYCSDIFASGVVKDEHGEYSYAARRTKFRGQRRLHRSRHYRIWRTLEVLIEAECCPLSIEDLNKWRRYNKSKGENREYPINAVAFEQWVRLDFNGDGIPDYRSPYQLREELATRQLDMSDIKDRYKLGRGLYHIAQRRGFKSSKGETIQSQEYDTFENTDTPSELRKSEQEKSIGLCEYMHDNNCPTVGVAFACLEREGVRIRANGKYQAVRSQYEEEIRYIFTFQNQLDTKSEFFIKLISRKKGEGSIFYKNPLRSQKGNVGKCTLEPSKSRCPVSRPEFEIFRAWSFLNNIKMKSDDGNIVQLPLQLRNILFNDLFFSSRDNITILDIKKKIRQNTEISDVELNYSDKTKVKTCSVSRCLKKILGEDWQSASLNAYTYEELWHVCYEADELEDVDYFADTHLKADEDVKKKLERLWGCITEGYAMLSLKAINNINRFLLKGYIYSDAVLLAKLPDVFGNKWHECEEIILKEFEILKQVHHRNSIAAKITNNLISAYKLHVPEENFAYKDYTYLLDESDKQDILRYCVDTLSKAGWDALPMNEQMELINKVETLYQAFFHDIHRDYVVVPKMTDTLRAFIIDNFAVLLDDSAIKKMKYLYHPSNISIYRPSQPRLVDCNGKLLSKKLLDNPDVGVFKNPVAMKTLYILRNHINELIKQGVVDEENTRVVVELARDMNDANMRKAIEEYQKKQEEENKQIADILSEYFPQRDITQDDIYKARLMFEQTFESVKNDNNDKEQKLSYNDAQFQKYIIKYKLLKEQNFRCIYTGYTINLTNLFNDNCFDFEHTIPRSISFDDSLANQTICDVNYNRNIKKNSIPTQLADYEQIKINIQPWIDRVEKLKSRVLFWKNVAKFATSKAQKDSGIQQMHLWRMELDYWSKKVRYFTITEDKLDLGFRNSQLVDTRIISKYAYHFLRSVFSNVDVQRGETTAVFRKALGIQSIDEKKNRSKHSHHAIDATVLTLIPSANRRDAILKLYYELQEAKEGLNGMNVDDLKRRLQAETAACRVKGSDNIAHFIEDNILINHITRDKALIPAKRLERRRGKVVLHHNETKPRIKTGDIIRGNIHNDPWYGAIKLPLIDENGKPLRDEQGQFKYDDKLRYVCRKSIRKLITGKKAMNWDDLEKVIVDKNLFNIMKSQYSNKSLKEAFLEGIYMLDKQGNRINKIRHIRCYAPSNIFPVPVKKHTYMPNKIYKQNYLADVGDLYALVRYENEQGKAVYQTYSLYDITQNRAHGLEDIPMQIEQKGTTYKFAHILRNGVSLLLYKESRDELVGQSAAYLSRFLYVIRGFESPSRIIMVHHLIAKKDSELGKGSSVKDFSDLPVKIRCGAGTIHYLIEGIDFKLTINGIEFL